MNHDDPEEIEIDLLLEAMWRRSGYDFRSYARSSIRRRVSQFLGRSGCSTVSEMTSRVTRDSEFLNQLAQYFSISVTGMFRDPWVYRAIREQAVPLLRSWHYFKVWHAGCATGEEVYSLAIVLQEEGLLDRVTLHATDFNDAAIEKARDGVYPLDKTRSFAGNYRQAGGTASLADHFRASGGSAVMSDALKQRVTFSTHNLVTDHVFGEMHLILCRNVLIYFDRDLQQRAVTLFADSLVHGGFLCLGTHEDIRLVPAGEQFELVDEKARLFKKTGRPRGGPWP